MRQLRGKYWRPDIALLVGALALSAAIIGANAVALGNLREDTLRSAKANLQSQAVVLAEEGERSFKALDMALSAIADTIGAADEPLEQRLAGHDTHDWLRDKAAGIPHADAIALVSAQGKLVNFTRSWPIPAIDITDRDYFKTLKADAAIKSFVSEPILNRSTGTWTIYLMRRLEAPNGNFLGLVLGAITIQHFENFFRSVALQDGSAIALVRDDGMLLVRYPRSDQIGKIIPAAARKSELQTGKPRQAQSPLDGQLRIISAKSLTSFPLIIVVSQTEASALRSWRTLADHSTTMALVGTLIVLFMALVACRWWGSQQRLTQALSVQNVRFDTALSNMGAGLCMFDVNERLVVANGRYADMYGLRPEQVQPGTPFRDIIKGRIALGAYAGGDPEAYVNERLAAVRERHASTKIQTLPDGRVIAIAHQPMTDGGWVATHEDITEQRRYEAKIAHMAHHDALTDLPNRVLLRERLVQALAGALREHHALAVFMLDLDRFKEINDTLGHSVGDDLLKSVAERLRAALREGATIARLGGDEFAIVEDVTNAAIEATAIAERIQSVLGAPFDLGDHQVVVGASVGIAVAPGDGADPDQLLKNADLALYRAKNDGRGTHRFFEPEMNRLMQERRDLERDLRSALVNGEFELYYQPYVDLQGGHITGCEALLRWHHPERGMVSPTEFIGLAEETGLIIAIGDWVLRKACAEAATWPDDVKVAVNLSAAQFKSLQLVPSVVSALANSGLGPQRLEIEVTESVMIQDSDAAYTTLKQLHDLGVRIALDDFGTGYSSLSFLHRYPFDKIKIDRAFVSELSGAAETSCAIVRSVVQLAVSLGKTTTAEGVETKEQLERVRAEGCTEGQGYYIGRPTPSSDIAAMLFTPAEKPADAA